MACGDPPPADVNKPTPPDMSSLTATYDSPQGTLTPENAARVYREAQDLVARIEELGVDEKLIDTVLDALEARQNGQSEARGAVVSNRQAQTEGEGYLVATRLCNGWGEEPVPDPENGDIVLTVGFTERGVDPIAWGEITLCRYVFERKQILLGGLGDAPAGGVRLSFGESLAFDQLGSPRVLVDLDLRAEVDGAPVGADLDFRLDRASSTLETRIPVDDGDVIAIASANSFAGVRAKNGDFVCDLSSQSCSDGEETVSF